MWLTPDTEVMTSRVPEAGRLSINETGAGSTRPYGLCRMVGLGVGRLWRSSGDGIAAYTIQIFAMLSSVIFRMLSSLAEC